MLLCVLCCVAWSGAKHKTMGEREKNTGTENWRGRLGTVVLQPQQQQHQAMQKIPLEPASWFPFCCCYCWQVDCPHTTCVVFENNEITRVVSESRLRRTITIPKLLCHAKTDTSIDDAAIIYGRSVTCPMPADNATHDPINVVYGSVRGAAPLVFRPPRSIPPHHHRQIYTVECRRTVGTTGRSDTAPSRNHFPRCHATPRTIKQLTVSDKILIPCPQPTPCWL